VEIKRGLSPAISRGMRNALEDLRPKQAFVVYSGDEEYPLGDGVTAIGLDGLARRLVGLMSGI